MFRVIILFLLLVESSAEICDIIEKCDCKSNVSFTSINCYENGERIELSGVNRATRIEIRCFNTDNKEVYSLFRLLPFINETYLVKNFIIILIGCPLSGAFSPITEKLPPIKDVIIRNPSIKNTNQNFFMRDLPLIRLAIDDDALVYSEVNVLRNLNNLERVFITLFQSGHILPPKLFEGNVNLRGLRMLIYGHKLIFPSNLFASNKLLDDVDLNFYGNLVTLENGLMSNKANLRRVSIINPSGKIKTFRRTPPKLADDFFCNSSSLEDIELQKFEKHQIKG